MDIDPKEARISERFVWYLANTNEPMLAEEFAEMEDENTSTVRHVLRRLYKRGLLVRRQRRTDKVGRNPYEYRLTTKEELDYLTSEDTPLSEMEMPPAREGDGDTGEVSQ